VTPEGALITADVTIVGAGPAGAAAAITARRAGLRVVMVDRATFPRDKCCGDGLTAEALRLLDGLGLDPTRVGSWTVVNDVVVRGPSGREVVFPLPRGDGVFAAVARRADLDAALVDVARAEGAFVVEGVAVVGARQDAETLTVELADGREVRAPYAIGADGMWSPLRKLLGGGLPDHRGEWHAFRQYLADVSPRAARELMVWFEPDFLPGYAWSFPLGDGGANVGFGIQRGTSYRVGDMKHLWPDLLARPHLRAFLGEGARPEAPHKAWPIPARVDAIPLSMGRALFVGDAAAATDPMTGEGIAQALATGAWAVEAIVAHRPRPSSVRAAYAARVRRELVPDHRLARLLVRAIRHRKGVRAAIAVAGATGWTRRNFARWLFEDYPRAVLFTPARWGPGMLRGHGAFAGGSTSRNATATSAS
jgi:geranylgeranyl reductase family protein